MWLVLFGFVVPSIFCALLGFYFCVQQFRAAADCRHLLMLEEAEAEEKAILLLQSVQGQQSLVNGSAQTALLMRKLAF